MKRLGYTERVAGQALADLGAVGSPGTTVRMVVLTAPIDTLNRFSAERALESLADRGLVATSGPRGDRSYWLSAAGGMRFSARRDPAVRDLDHLGGVLAGRVAA